MEAAKVGIQTQPGYAAPKMCKEEGLKVFYKGVAPLWMRQIPYTMFACSECTVADSVVSVLNKEKGISASQVLKKLGFRGVWKGLFARIIMIGTLTELQWFIYDSVKVYFRLPHPPTPEMPESLKKKLGYTK